MSKPVKIKIYEKVIKPKIRKTKWKVIEGEEELMYDPSMKKVLKRKK